MAGRNRVRGFNDSSLESTDRSAPPSAARSGRKQPAVAYSRPRGYIPPSGTGRPQPVDSYGDEEDNEEELKFRGGASNDNPLYEVEDEDSRFQHMSSTSRETSPNTNPLYGNDPFRLAPSSVCMTEFLRPKGGPSKDSGYRSDPHEKSGGNFDNGGNFISIAESMDEEEASNSSRRISPPARPPPSRRGKGLGLFRAPRVDQTIDESTDEDETSSSSRRISPPARSAPPRRAMGLGVFRASRGDQTIDESTDGYETSSSSRRISPPARSRPPQRNMGLFRAPRWDQTIVRYPPARFSPVLPAAAAGKCDAGQLVGSAGPKGKRTRHRQAAASTSNSSSIPPSQCPAPNIGDLIAAVRSDKNLLIGEVRKHANREPRVPGDHDRHFAPRKGDIIIHFTPSLDGNKLLEYYDDRKSMLRLQPGDKLVRVKYDNYKLPDHLMITSKLYLYAPEWVYLGKALQTIKTV